MPSVMSSVTVAAPKWTAVTRLNSSAASSGDTATVTLPTRTYTRVFVPAGVGAADVPAVELVEVTSMTCAASGANRYAASTFSSARMEPYVVPLTVAASALEALLLEALAADEEGAIENPAVVDAAEDCRACRK